MAEERSKGPGLDRWWPPAAVAIAAAGWLVGWLIWPASWRFQLFLGFTPAMAMVGWGCRRALTANPEAALWFFLGFAGVPLLAFTPPIASVAWDGQTHFSAALAISQGGDAVYTGADQIMTNRDGIYEVGLIPFGTSEDDWTPNWRLSLSEEGLARQVEVLEAAEISWPYRTTHGFARFGDDGEVLMGGVSVAARAPMALGLWLGRTLGLPTLGTYALGRVCNYLLWCLLTWVAMRRLVSGRWLFLAICLLPTQLYIACNWSYDPWVVGFAAIATTSLLGELQRPERRLTVANGLWMIVPWYLSCATKAIFFPWAIVFLCLPRAKFRSRGGRWAWWILWVATMGYLLYGFMAPFLQSQGASNVDTQSVSDVRPWDQLHLMAREPWRYASGLALTTLDYVNPWRIFSDVPVDLCYLPRPLGWWILSAVELVGLLWLTLADRSEADAWARTHEGRRLRLVALIGFVVAFGALLTALYVAYNEVGSYYILGMQARYYLAFLPLILGVMLDDDGTGAVRWIWRHLPPGWRPALGLPRTVDPEGEAELAATPRPWWLGRSGRARATLVIAEGVLLTCLVVLGFVVWF